MTGRMAGQTINDRLLAAKHSLAGQGLAKSVCKATTEEMIGPKKKHLDYLVHCTNEPNVSIPQLANLLIERSQNTNWIVVYKALITVHHMMCYGNERFTQYLASSNSTFQLSNFLDKSGVQGILSVRTGYDMSPFIRRYSKYLNEKAMSYRTVAFDFCKVKRGKGDGMLRTMNADKLLKTLPILQNQLDSLLEFDCNSNDLTNGVINMCFMLLFRDLIRLFACYNDGIINLLEKYFDMNKKQCKEALDIYKKFLVRMDKVADFLKVAENVGIDKGDIPDLTKAPSSLLDALEQHLTHLEGRKNSQSGPSSSQSSSNHSNIKSGVSALSSTSHAFGTVVASDRFDFNPSNGIDENLKLQVLAEEEAAMNQFKQQSNKPSAQPSMANNPFLSNSSSSRTISSTQDDIDLFDSEPVPQNAPKKISDDLLQLSNPFATPFMQPPANPAITNAQPFAPAPQPNMAWMTNGNLQQPTSPILNGGFVSENNFASVFGTTESNGSGFDALGGVLQPLNAGGRNNGQTINNNNNVNNNSNGHQNDVPLLTGDLESSLASLAENLTINPRAVPVKGVQWNSPKNGSKANWTPQPLSATTGAGYKPMNQAMVSPSATTPTALQPQIFPQFQPLAGMRPTAMIPPISPMSGLPNSTNQMGQQSLLFH